MEEKIPKVSVIMPSYNVKNFISQCIESVMNQTLTDIEIICVDAGSDDGTLDILKEYAQKDERINVFLSNKKSYGSQVNQGITNARGEYISIIETDDYVREDMLQSLYDLTQLGFIDIVKGNFYHVYELEDNVDIKIDTAKKQLSSLDKFFSISDYPLFLEGHPSIWAAIYKKSFLINNNILFNEEKGGSWVDNPFFYETALKADTIKYTNTPYYYYRETNDNSSSNNLNDLSIPIKRIKEMFEILENENCTNKQIHEMLYKRLFRYIEIIEENNDNTLENIDYETGTILNNVLGEVNIDYVREKLSNEQKQIYYKFRSPLILMQFNS